MLRQSQLTLLLLHRTRSTLRQGLRNGSRHLRLLSHHQHVHRLAHPPILIAPCPSLIATAVPLTPTTALTRAATTATAAPLLLVQGLVVTTGPDVPLRHRAAVGASTVSRVVVGVAPALAISSVVGHRWCERRSRRGWSEGYGLLAGGEINGSGVELADMIIQVGLDKGTGA